MDVQDKTILITGGTGSLGRRFTDNLLTNYYPKKVIILSRDELKQHEMRRSLNDDKRLRFFIGDVRDRQRLEMAFNGVDYVLHAAALKQVPAAEYNPTEFIKTNINGAENVIHAALACDVPKVIALSTDKACLAFSSPVELSNGHTITIRDMVNCQGSASVKTLDMDNNEFIEGEVVDWYKNSIDGRKLIKVIPERTQYMGKHNSSKGLILTEDHLMLTPKGWKEAGKLKNGDLLVTSSWDLDKCKPYVTPIKIEKTKQLTRDVYCINVKKTHNFCAGGFVVKNCSPCTLYGATKLVSDKLFVAANNMAGGRSSRFSVVRYGNVAGSRGSVIPVFKKMIAEGTEYLPITDPRMTRFWITLDQAVSLVDYAFSDMRGGETYIPKLPSIKIDDLATAMAPHMKKKIIGIRAGEKIHEIMCPYDVAHLTLEFPDYYIIKPTIKFNKLEESYNVSSNGIKGRAVTDDFEYSSGTNPRFLTVEEIKKELETCV